MVCYYCVFHDAGGFEDVDLKDDWEDDVDYDLDLVPYYESIKKPSKVMALVKLSYISINS